MMTVPSLWMLKHPEQLEVGSGMLQNKDWMGFLKKAKHCNTKAYNSSCTHTELLMLFKLMSKFCFHVIRL